MPDSPAATPPSRERQLVDRWLQPLGDPPCGDDLEYDPQFLELTLAAAGKPATSFSEAEPPEWGAAKALAEPLLDRTRDLRVGLLWVRASVQTDGYLALGEGLRLLTGWLGDFWEGLHPALDPDDGDAFARISALGTLIDLNGLLGDVRQSMLLADRRLGGLRVRDVEVALDRLPARPDDSPRSRSEIEGLLADLPELAERLRVGCDANVSELLALQRQMNDRLGIDHAVDVKPLRAILTAVRSLIPEAAQAAADDATADDGAAPSGSAPAAGAPRRGSGPGSIDTRADAIKAIQLVCAYLERSEPTNPAQLLLRRAERLIGKNFLQLVKDMAPDALSEVARIMGVDPDQISVDEDRQS